MIRAGRRALTAEQVARAMGRPSARAAKAAGLFDDPALPEPIHWLGGPQRRVKPLWDAEQIAAHTAGEAIPALPAEGTDLHPDDLLDTREAAAVWEIEPGTWEWYRRNRPHAIPEPAAKVGGIVFYRRGDVTGFERSGVGGGAAGRPKGVAESRPRLADTRVTILELLTERPRSGYEIGREIGARAGRPTGWRPTWIYRTLRDLAAEGLIEEVEGTGGARSTVYQPTEAGRRTPAWTMHRGRGARLDRVRQLAAAARRDQRTLTAREVMADLGVTDRHARRLIAAAHENAGEDADRPASDADRPASGDDLAGEGGAAAPQTRPPE